MSQKRIVIVIVLFCIPFLLLGLRLFSLQVVDGSYYRIQAQKQITRIEQIPPNRGRIFDRQGSLLASSEAYFDLFLVPAKFTKPSKDISTEPTAQIVRRLAKLLNQKIDVIQSRVDAVNQKIDRLAEGKTPREKRNILRQQRNARHKLIAGVPFDIALEIEANPDLFAGIIVSETIKRAYPQRNCAAHILGYLASINEKEYANFTENSYFRSLLHPQVDDDIYGIFLNRGDFKDDVIGRTGIEKYYNATLTGQAGVRLIETDYLYKQKRELSRISPIHGSDITLTIDKALQSNIENLLRNKTGAAIVMDIANGEILALESAPSYDPNKLLSPVAPETVQQLFNNPARPLYNRAVSGEYALGSVFKIVTAVAGLESGKINQSTSFVCDGYYSKSHKHFRCWVADYNREHGRMSLADAIQHSCNVFFFNAGKTTGAEPITQWARTFGFGQPTGIDLPAESRGAVPDQHLGAERGRRPWAAADTLNLSIGQGDLLVTPIQTVRMMAAIANGGQLVTPHIVRNLAGALPAPVKINISPKTISILQEALYNAVNSEGGTAYGRGLGGYSVCGKTSTAEVGKGKSHAWFAGFAPYPKPRIAFVVVIEHGGKGSEMAAPVAAEFMPYALAVISRDNSPAGRKTPAQPERQDR
jgi:penicillin-binding protein 2